MTTFRAAILLLGLAAAQAVAQPMGGQVQPDRIAFGTVHTGSIVEASFMVFEPGTDPNIKLEVTAPKFAKVLKKATHYQQFGPGNDFVCGSIEIAVDTSAAKELSGEVSVTLGTTIAKLPVSVTVKPRRPGLHRLLMVETPFHRHSTKDGEAFKPLTNLVKEARIDANYLLVTRGKPVLRDLDLNRFDCILLGATGLFDMMPNDVKRARAFAERGGRLVVAANAFFVGSSDILVAR